MSPSGIETNSAPVSDHRRSPQAMQSVVLGEGPKMRPQNPFLSSLDGLSIPWIDSPFFDHLLGCSELIDHEKELVRFFSEKGYLVFDPGIPETLLDQVTADLVGKHPLDG